MRIYSMTATFGKLENETLTFQPGLNVIEAPNEWGKSTWCAFLAAMLYGIDTRERTSADHLADKERYAPWSGSPMSGRIDLCWNGRDVTIERTTGGRIPMGHFRAYETKSGLAVPELTAANCGQLLLGVERSVFLRTGFLRLSDMPVTQDEALVARLNALVTTGDEGNTAVLLSSRLKELKNRCRYNRTGLIPQAEAERTALEQKLSATDDALAQSQRLNARQRELEAYATQLDNHRAALEYTDARSIQSQLADARSKLETAAQRIKDLEPQCSGLPPRDTIENNIQQLQQLQGRLSFASTQLQHYPQEPGRNTPAQAEADSRRYRKLRSPLFLILTGISLLGAAIGAALHFLAYPAGLYLFLSGAVLALLFLAIHLARRSRAKKLTVQYGSSDPAAWRLDAEAQALRQSQRQALEAQIADLNRKITALTGGHNAMQALLQWQQNISALDQLNFTRLEYRQAEAYVRALTTSFRPAMPPKLPDTMTQNYAETAQLQEDTACQLRQLQQKLGLCRGRLEQLGSREDTLRKLKQINERIARLEETYQALTLAQQALDHAQAQLQRRFAPQITAHARDIMARLTGARYDKLRLDRELNLLSGAENEVTLHSPLWRSDGTADQLYLALRLAVAKALTPDAPLVLDDALVRFDDARLKAALEILKEEARHKQILLFTCQSREKKLLS